MAADNKRILVVDDLAVFRELQQKFLRKAGYDVDTASSGREALERARTYHPHLILVDLYMPEMDGATCCERIKNDPELNNIPVVISTSKGDEEDLTRCIGAGCDGYIKKIVTHTQFLAEVQRALNAKVRSPSRCPVSVNVSYVALAADASHDADEHPEQRGVAVNLSPVGMFILTEEPPEVGEILRLEFDLPGITQHFQLSGEVIRSANKAVQGTLKPSFDLHFMDISASTARLIEKYIEERIPEQRPKSSTTTRRIVVADDSKFWRDKIAAMLSRSGHEVIAVEDGESVVRLSMDSTRPVDLVVLDLVMPSVDGFAVARYLRNEELTEKIPIIGFTGVYSRDHFPDGPRAHGFNAVLEKSASADEFLFVFNKYLHSPPPPQEFRPAPRVAAQLPAEYRCEDGRIAPGVIMNVSTTGAYISTSRPLEAGTDLALTFRLPDGLSIQTLASVVWMNEARLGSPADYSKGMGVVFKGMEPGPSAALERYTKAESERY